MAKFRRERNETYVIRKIPNHRLNSGDFDEINIILTSPINFEKINHHRNGYLWHFMFTGIDDTYDYKDLEGRYKRAIKDLKETKRTLTNFPLHYSVLEAAEHLGKTETIKKLVGAKRDDKFLEETTKFIGDLIELLQDVVTYQLPDGKIDTGTSSKFIPGFNNFIYCVNREFLEKGGEKKFTVSTSRKGNSLSPYMRYLEICFSKFPEEMCVDIDSLKHRALYLDSLPSSPY